MNLTKRKYQSEADFWKMRHFLRHVFMLNNCLEHSWSLPRLDYWIWHFTKTCDTPLPEENTALWETEDGELVAFVNAIDPGEAYLHVHPNYRSKQLEHEMMDFAENHLAMSISDGKRKLFMLADEDDTLRHQVLKERGYIYRDQPVHRWRRNLDEPIPSVPVPNGYRVRSMGGPEEYDARAWASWTAFHPDDPDEDFENGDWFINMQMAPLYRRDLDIVAEAPDGSIAAFSTIWYDDYTRSAVCVVVGTDKNHQRLGLGKVVLTEGFRRLKKMGGLRVFANGFDIPASALYQSALGTKYNADSYFKIIGE